MGKWDQVERLYDEYSNGVYRYLLSMCHDPQAAEDILQSTFLQVLGGYAGFRGDCTARTWIFTIARNEYFRYLRKNPSHAPLDETIPASGDLAQDYTDRERIRRIFKYIENLEEPLRTLMSLRILGGLSFAEISSILGKSEVWARVTFMRCKNKLLDQLEEGWQ